MLLPPFTKDMKSSEVEQWNAHLRSGNDSRQQVRGRMGTDRARVETASSELRQAI